MTPEEHRDLREQLGALVLGQLPDDRAAALRAHLTDCAGCSAELADIAVAAGALRRLVPEDAVAPPPDPPAGLRDAILERIRTETVAARRARLLRRVGLGLAAAAAVVAAFTAGAVTADDVRPAVVAGPLVEPVSLSVRQPGVTASAGLVAHTWGTELKLDAVGLERGGAYRVEISDTQGRSVAAGTFIGTGAGELRCNLNAALLRPNAVAASVTDAAGTVVMRADLT